MFTFFEMLCDLTKFVFCILFVFISIAVLGIFFYCITGCAEQNKKANQEIHDCFIQEPRTKECEYILWQYELKKINTQTHNNNKNIATGVILGAAMSGAIRR